NIVQTLGIPETDVHVTPLAAGPPFRPIEDRAVLARELEAFGLRETPYILYVGTIETRKNHEVLLRAFDRLKRLEPSLRHKLVFIGPKWHGHEAVFAAISRLRLDSQVLYLESVPRLELLYNGADLLVFPSLYEGFGLPPLEAMACGTPVVTSNTTSLPEVVGDAGVMVDPRDEEAVCEAMRRVLTDGRLRELLVTKGLERAGTFSWKRTTEQTLEVCRLAHQRFR
ncbi:MAG: glycosyltransferase family 4 protein, partial [Acidimicrobiia bacterium]